MSKALGIHLAGRRFQLVALDGTFKKPKVRACVSGNAPDAGDATPEGLGDQLKAAAKENRKALESDNIGLAVESSLATFRSLALPFAEASKIEEVLKFEVEGQLPQWDIDAVVIDFHTVKATPVESQLLVTAVPKEELARRIGLAERAGLEPFDAEIEATALFRAAEQQGVLEPERAQVLVHFGGRTTTFVTVVEGRLSAMRALHLDLEGFDHSLESGSPEVAEAPSDEGSSNGVDETGPVAAPVAARPAADEARARSVRERIERELARTMGGSRSDVEFDSILVCGIDLPGLVDTQVADVPITRLDPLEGLTELGPEDRAHLVIAFGTALGRLGGSAIKPHLRREELTYASRFERLELPLGVLGLLILTLLASRFIIDQKVLASREADIQRWLAASRNYMIGQFGTDIVGALRPRAEEYESDPLCSYVEQIATDGDPIREYGAQIGRVESLMGQKIRALEEDLGAARDLTLPQSAMTGLNLVLDVLRELDAEESVGRFSIRSATARYVEGRGREATDRVQVELDLTFFGANDLEGSRSFSAFFSELERQPWVASEIERPSTTPLTTGEGIFLNGLRIDVDTTKADVEG